jgi:hypothetical protein
MKGDRNRSRGGRSTACLITGVALTLVFGLVVGMAGTPAAAQRTVSIQPLATGVSPGGTFTLRVFIDDAAGVAGFQFDLVYNGALIGYVAGSLAPGDLIQNRGWTLASNLLTNPLRLRILGYRIPTDELPGGSGSLAKVDFQASLTNTGVTPVSIEGAFLSDRLGYAIPVTGVGGCVRVGTCDDGDACTTDALDPATCECLHTPKNCDDGNACTTDSCNAATGCVHTPKNCDDGNACTTDACDPVTGNCTHTPKNCDDGNACTTDACDPATGNCTHTPKNCDDGNACTTDSCNAATGCTHTSKNCDDRNPCTVDTCDPVTGNCVYTPKNCDDGNACTTDSCNAKTGVCVHTSKNCDDRNPCTVDTCDPVTGNCVYTPKNCDDGNACTTDSCNAKTGACIHTSKNCDDSNPCTVDTCDPVTGQCIHTPSGRVEVGITSFAVPSRVKVGQTQTLRVTIANSGCADTWVQCTVSKPGQTIGTQNVWVLKGSTATAAFPYTFTASDVPNVCFTATISATGDVNPANNQATACTKVTR